MKILYVITGLGDGGAEKIASELADQMLIYGHTVKIVYLKGNIVIHPKSNDIEIVYLGLEKLVDIFKAFQNYKKLLHEFKPDVVHAHMVHANIFVRICRNFIPVPRLICSAHSSNEGGWLRMIAYKLTHKFAEVTTNVSQSASKKFEELGAVPSGKIITVYNGIDLTKFEKKNDNDKLRKDLGINIGIPVFLAIGRLDEAKDYSNLLHAFSIFKETLTFKEKQPILLIAGDGELRSELENLICNLNLQSDVILLGRRDDIAALLNMSDFFVLSSKYEGLPTVVIEAMACETYVIATDCGGSAEIMGTTGKLIPIQNSVALSNAINEVLKLSKVSILDNNLVARKRVEDKFSLKSSVERWIELYES
ncbi:glycosyltransferase [Acinetobacter sp. ANC 5414]|uniref:glycosyltransferase n=1 Tax=Acinetobacter sp. ANC 5414 TaxID=2731251 RepID=UPI00148FA48E|nr:glycosyltransferase [Acinetobacter sp. ANC 5414]NNH00065.1 glycosyltransferase [Acinetobacter sp. ANC 5414]